MENHIRLTIAVSLFSIICIANPVKAQTTQTPVDSTKFLSAEVLTVLKKCCFDCHSEPGKIMPLEKLNFTKWNEYKAEKQVSKANAMCEEVTKGKMPPSKYREKNPDAVPTPEDLKIICDWVQSMQAAGK